MTGETLSSLVVDVRPGERIVLSSQVSIELVQKSGRCARLRVLAPREVEIKKEGGTACEFRDKHGEITTG